MDWTQLDWDALDRLRDGFLNGSAASGPYWRSMSDLANYDLTFGERIGWKWDAVLAELKVRGWSPSATTLLDWGCGSGIAARRLLRAFPNHFTTLRVWDHSPLATDFAIDAARREFPQLHVERFDSGQPVGLLVLSHVLNELALSARNELLEVIRRADAVIWVEPGTHVVSRELIAMREQLRSEFHVVAPCTHRETCGLLAAENARHWCHAFAAPPAGIYADSDWVRFGQRAGIDLRSLPYSFLVLQKTPAPSDAPTDDLARIIGEPRHYKGFARLLSCDRTGVTDLMLQKRDDPALFKRLKRDAGVPVYRWRRDGERIVEATPVVPSPAE